MRRTLALMAATALFLSACGESDDADGGDATTTTVESTTSEPEATTSTEPTETTEPTEATEPEGSDPAPDPADLPGEVFDLYPYEDASLAVVGVDRGDVLNLRAGPGTNFVVLAELPPIATGLVATGHNRTVDDQIWAEVTVDGETGWVNNRYVLQMGSVDDVTSELGELPGAETMVDLANIVGEMRSSDEPPSRIAVVEDPVVGDLGEIMVDVIGMADDSVGGERLHILATPTDGGEGFVVQSVERITLCSRGVTDDFLCL